MIISAKDCWSKAKSKHNTYFNSSVTAARDALKNELPLYLYDFLVTNHDKIRDGNENSFRLIHKEYSLLRDKMDKATKDSVDKNLGKIFNYDLFCDITVKRWSAYKLCEELNILTCPYCNLSYGHTITREKKGGIRPSLDHFFDKATHPLFAISLNNLVPSCHHCNSSLKGSVDFRVTRHLNPMLNAESIKISLNVDPVDGRKDLTLFDSAKIILEYDLSDPRCVNSVKTFLLAERYALLVKEARLIAKHMVTVSTGGDFDSQHIEWALRGVSSDNYRDRILGKMIRDLSAKYLARA
ncbi:hypothetical protein LPN04_15595 [Rugamonas sp. A1-17]|nr:hypothetical protein [Rugamonas sp. A1-17]